MKYLKVNLWGQEIGRLVWDSTTRRTTGVPGAGKTLVGLDVAAKGEY